MAGKFDPDNATGLVAIITALGLGGLLREAWEWLTSRGHRAEEVRKAHIQTDGLIIAQYNQLVDRLESRMTRLEVEMAEVKAENRRLRDELEAAEEIIEQQDRRIVEQEQRIRELEGRDR